MANPVEQLGTVLTLLSDFGTYSGFKMNVSKCEILPLNPLDPHSLHSLNSLGLSVAKTNITYLGIKIGANPNSLYALNFPPILKRIREELRRWHNLPLAMSGRCHLIKMMSISNLMYPLQTIPVLIHHTDITNLDRALSYFIWRGKRPRICLNKLKAAKADCGNNLPDVRGYNLACLTRHFIDWIHRTSHFSSYSLEADLGSPGSLVALLHTPMSKLP